MAGGIAKRQENLVLIQRIADLLHDYTEEEITQLVADYQAQSPKTKKRPRGRTAPKSSAPSATTAD